MIAIRCAVFLAAFWFAAAAAVRQAAGSEIVLSRPWIAAPPPGAAAAAGYVSIANDGETADRLLSAAAGFAGGAGLHVASIDEKGVMAMRPVDGGLAIPPGGTVVLEPGGRHLMFMSLLEPLKEGDRRIVTLAFERAGAVEAEFVVLRRRAGAMGEEAGADRGNDRGDES